jgi:hypothetical protein
MPLLRSSDFAFGAPSPAKWDWRRRSGDGSRFYRGTPGFMAVTLTAKEMRVEVIDYTGASLYEKRVAAEG